MKEPKYSFDIDGCREMFQKLIHEIGLCHSTDDRPLLSYHLVNFAMTAYHLIEWVWSDLETLPSVKAKLGADIGLAPGEFSKEKFYSYVLNQCPGLRICQAIANGTKHVEYDGPYSGYVETAYVSGQPLVLLAGVPDGAAKLSEIQQPTGIPKVIVDGETSGDVRNEFEQVVQWWNDFIRRRGIDRFNGPSNTPGASS